MRKVATIILAAGKGTRMNSEKPKVIFKLAGKPMINKVVETAKKVDSDLIVVVVGYKKDLVIDTVPADDNIKFVEQIEQNGTGDAVMVTEKEFQDFSGDIFVLCGDVPLLRHQTLEKMLQHHREKNAACTVLTAIMDDALRYGRIVRNKDNSVQRIVEFKDATDQEKQIIEINTGIYCFDAQSLFLALEKVTNNNNQEEYYLTDTLEILNEESRLVISVILEDIIEVSGVNSRKQLSDLENEFYRRQDHFEN